MNEQKRIQLSEEDRQKLVKMYCDAQRTPVIGFSTLDMIEGRDLASLAWDRLRGEIDALGKKYGFDPKKMKGIHSQTGEVLIE